MLEVIEWLLLRGNGWEDPMVLDKADQLSSCQPQEDGIQFSSCTARSTLVTKYLANIGSASLSSTCIQVDDMCPGFG